MATRRFKVNPGEQENQVVEEVGGAVNSAAVELTVELAATVNIPGGTRTISKAELLEALEKIKNHIIKANWPPA